MSLKHDGVSSYRGAGIAVIRPEDVVPLEDGASEIPANCLDAKISELEFLGSFWRTYLAAPDLGDQVLRADFSVNAVRRLSLDEGKSIKIVLPPDRLRVFADGANPSHSGS